MRNQNKIFVLLLLIIPVALSCTADSGNKAGGELPGDWPESVPLMEGFQVAESRTEFEDGDHVMFVAAISDEPMQDVISFYDTISGWTEAESSEMEPARENEWYKTFMKDEDKFLMVNVVEEDDGRTAIALTFVISGDET